MLENYHLMNISIHDNHIITDNIDMVRQGDISKDI